MKEREKIMRAQHHHSINEFLDSLSRKLDIQIQEILKCAAYSEGVGIGYCIHLNNATKVKEELRKIKKKFISVNHLNSVKQLIELHQLIDKIYPNLQFSSYEHLIKPKILTQAKIELLLDTLEEKAQNLTERNYLPAASAAQQIITELYKLNDRYFIKEVINDAEYKIKALETIEKNKSILEEHRDYNYIIANFVLAILTVGTALLVHKVKYGNFLFFNQTDSAQKIAPLRQLITEQNETQFSLCKR